MTYDTIYDALHDTQHVWRTRPGFSLGPAERPAWGSLGQPPLGYVPQCQETNVGDQKCRVLITVTLAGGHNDLQK